MNPRTISKRESWIRLRIQIQTKALGSLARPDLAPKEAWTCRCKISCWQISRCKWCNTAILCHTVSIRCFRKVRHFSRMPRVVEVVCTQAQENAFLDRCQSNRTQIRWCLGVSTCIIHIWCNRCSPTQVFRRSFQCKLSKHLSLELILLSTQTLVITILHMECLKQDIRPVTTKTNSIKCMVCQATQKPALSLPRKIWNPNQKTSKWAILFQTMKWCLALLTLRSL